MTHDEEPCLEIKSDNNQVRPIFQSLTLKRLCCTTLKHSLEGSLFDRRNNILDQLSNLANIILTENPL